MKSLKYLAVLFLAAPALTGCLEEEPSEETKEITQTGGYIEPIDLEAPDGVVGEDSFRDNIVVVYDTSGSMGYSPDGSCKGDEWDYKYIGAKDAFDLFLETVPSEHGLGLVVFDDHIAKVEVELSDHNKEKIGQSVAELKFDDDTPLGHAMMAGVDMLVNQRFAQNGHGTFRLLVISDGANTAGPPVLEAMMYATLRQIPVYTVGICDDTDGLLRTASQAYTAGNSTEQIVVGLETVQAEVTVSPFSD